MLPEEFFFFRLIPIKELKKLKEFQQSYICRCCCFRRSIKQIPANTILTSLTGLQTLQLLALAGAQSCWFGEKGNAALSLNSMPARTRRNGENSLCWCKQGCLWKFINFFSEPKLFWLGRGRDKAVWLNWHALLTLQDGKKVQSFW